jgi:hypothetical protein
MDAAAMSAVVHQFEEMTGAVISPCGLFRYRLWRRWDRHKPRLLWVMLNPSTADARLDDPTIAACIAFAKALGYGGIEVVNLYAFRATDPKALKRAGYPIGPDNDLTIRAMARAIYAEHGMLIAGWGAHAQEERADAVREMLQMVIDVHVLHLNGGGSPKHPLYIARSAQPQPWRLW